MGTVTVVVVLPFSCSSGAPEPRRRPPRPLAALGVIGRAPRGALLAPKGNLLHGGFSRRQTQRLCFLVWGPSMSSSSSSLLVRIPWLVSPSSLVDQVGRQVNSLHPSLTLVELPANLATLRNKPNGSSSNNNQTTVEARKLTFI